MSNALEITDQNIKIQKKYLRKVGLKEGSVGRYDAYSIEAYKCYPSKHNDGIPCDDRLGTVVDRAIRVVFKGP